MTNQNSDNSKNGGFFIGFILGVAAALLLSNKKGRKMLKKFIDHGMEKVWNWEDAVNEVLESGEDLIEGDDYLAQPELTNQNRKVNESHTESVPDIDKETEHYINDGHSNIGIPRLGPDPETVAKVKSATRRFFRGIKRK